MVKRKIRPCSSALLLLASACSSAATTAAPSGITRAAPSTSPTPAVTRPTTPPSTTATAPAAVLSPRPCDTSADLPPTDCYWLEVPERRDVVGARTIRLWVAVVHRPGATADATPSIYLTGGPGQAASTAFVDGHLTFVGTPTDVVVLDQRGSGRSEPHLDCPEMAAPLDSTHPWADRLSAVRASAQECRDRLVAQGVDLNGYDTVENAADVVALRTALGYRTWTVTGVSYGGRLAREVLRQDPGGVAALILESSLTTATAGPASLLRRADDSIARLSAACAAQPSCSTADGDVAADLATAATRLDAAPHRTLGAAGTPTVIGGSELYAGAFQALYRTDLIPLLPGVAAALAKGDDSVLDAMAGQLQTPPAADPRDDYATGLDDAVTCADEAASYTDADRQAIADPGRWGTLLIGWPAVTCDVWNVDPVPGGHLQEPSASVPVLAVYGSLDPVTPPEFAAEIRAQFPSAHTLLYPGGGHGVLFMNDCAVSIAVAFQAHPTDPLDTSCVATMPQPFAPG